MGLSWQDIGRITRQYLNEISTDYVTDEVLIDAINSAIEQVNADTEINCQSVTITLESGVGEYTLNNSILNIYRATYLTADSVYKLKPISIPELDRDFAGWESYISDAPTYVYAQGNILGLFPIPGEWTTFAINTSYEINDLFIPPTPNGYIYRVTAAGTSGSEIPSFPTSFDETNTSGSITFKCDREDHIHLLACISPDPITALTSDEPEWCPNRFRQTIAKAAALAVASGWDISGQVSPIRIQTLMASYTKDVGQMAILSRSRISPRQSSVLPNGYRTFTRRV